MNHAGEIEPRPSPPKVWVLAGHKAGDNAQLTALANALGWPFEVKRLAYRPTELATNLLLRVTLAGTAPSRSTPLRPPWPDLVLTAGRRNEPVARWIKSASGGSARLVHVGITPAALEAAALEWGPRLAHLPHPRIAVLVGGSSPPYRFGAEEAAELGRLVEAKAAQIGGSLLVTTSARTPPEAVAALQAELHVPCQFHRWRAGSTENPYRGFLALADEIVVTGDSISMLAEATATGKPFSIFDLGGMQDRSARALSSARDGRSLLHLVLMRVVPHRLRRDVRILLQGAVASGRAAWLGEPPVRPPAGSAEDLPRAVEAVRRLFPEA